MDDRWLNLVRLARDCGDLSSLFPPGIERLADLPYTIHSAIVSALGFLSFEELPNKERPPKSIWLFPKRMKEWWAGVEQMRKEEIENPDRANEPMDKSPLRDQLLVGFDR